MLRNKNNLKYILIIISFQFINISNSQTIDIGIFNDKTVKKVFIESNAGKYIVKSDNKRIYSLKKERSLILNTTKNGISLSNMNKDFGLHNSIKIIGKKYGFFRKLFVAKKNRNHILNVKLINPEQKTRKYDNDIYVFSKKGNLQLINKVEMPNYIAGVVEAESGSKAEFEYYKNQAVICRTYAIKNSDKHKNDGFNLCDGVHCQAYKGKSTSNEKIISAVKETKDLVIVDKNDELISAVFSANCGGQTNNSEDVWISEVPYLRSVTDSFCTNQRQATWTKEISVKDWKDFLRKNSVEISDTIISDSLYFNQEKRLKNYSFNNHEIKLSTIRFGLNLRSTFFSIIPDKDKLILKGKGYGHGVGMCQEGAMNMAKKGYNFEDIIKFYYKDVKIKNLKAKLKIINFVN
ncbi:MAG: SpoIID/LytB domain-containing protein [Bacteroidales bacterium]|nr:SpoIID/LytB domain-containing protein [Bacteroidales bacterium]MBN2756049.1 SpoIID/LytB domain-containing protein [Bacteroidales bacterium]